MECICGNKTLEIKTEDDSLFIEGKEYSYTTEFYYCSKCGREWLSPEQLDKQCSQITEIKRHAAGFLTPREIAELRKRHGITQEQAAIIFGGGRNAFSKYERGESYPSRAMDNLMRLFDECIESKKQLISKSDLPEKEKNYLLSASLALEIEEVFPAQHIFIFEKYVHAIIPVNNSPASWRKNETA